MKCALKSEIVVAHKDTQTFFSHDNQKTNCSSRMFTEWTTAKFTVGRDWPHHDRSRSDTVMNYINFNSYANLVMFFMIPAWFYLFLNTKLYMLYECYLCLIFIAVRKLTISLGVKTFETRTAHFIFSLRIFVSAHVF